MNKKAQLAEYPSRVATSILFLFLAWIILFGLHDLIDGIRINTLSYVTEGFFLPLILQALIPIIWIIVTFIGLLLVYISVRGAE